MGWLNYYGAAIMAVIMIPNIIFAVKNKGAAGGNSGAEETGGTRAYTNKIAVILEQIGRYGCLILMIFNIPYTYFGFWFGNALTVYLCVNGGLCAAYIIFWIICWNRNGKLKALSLSVIPSVIFIFSGAVLADIPLLVFAAVFAVNHILISYKSV